MSQQFVDVLLDGVSIRESVSSFNLDRRRNSAVDTLTLRLVDFSLYSLFDFGLVPIVERIHVGTSTASPKIDGSTVSTNIFTSAGSDFTAEGVTTDDIIFVILSDNKADEGGHEITAVGTTTLDTNFTFGTASGIKFIILKNQGRFFVEKPDVIESEEDIAIPSLWGRNALARLTDPFVDKLTKTFPRKQNFSDIVKDLVKDAGMDETKVIIDIDDFVVPGNLLTISNQLPLDIITNLARKTNGYVRSQKTGDLIIKKDFFHFAGVPIAQVIGDNELRQLVEKTDYPEFGNRVLVRSVTPEAAQDVLISLTLDTGCTRGDGRQPVPATAVITNQRGLPVADGTAVDWNITSTDGVPIVFTVAHQRTLTTSPTITDEEKRSDSLLSVSTDLPIRDVLGVYLKMDIRKLTNFFTGGTFNARSITLARELPFSNTLVHIDYVAGGVAKNTIRSFAGVPEGSVNFVNALIGRIRDTVSLCISNTRNISISLVAEPSEFNLCLVGSHSGTITAVVRDNGIIGTRVGIFWSLVGLGSLSNLFTIVRNQPIDSENQTSRNLFTVSTKYDIASVVGVWRADDGKASTNLFTLATERVGSFDEREITLGTNLPFNKDRVIIEYVAESISRIQYVAPENQEGPSVVQVIAQIKDGTDLGITEAEEILLNFVCPDDEGIPGVDPSTGLPTEPAPEPDCEKSSAAAKSCNLNNDTGTVDGLAGFTECVCGFLLGGAACPDDEAACRTMCQNDYNSNGFSSMLCDTETTDQFCRRETGNRSLAVLAECRSEHNASTVDACIARCLDHEVEEEEVEELIIVPSNPVSDCENGGTIQLEAQGGSPPYTWSVDAPEGTPQLQVGGGDGRLASIAPQINQSTLPDNFIAFQRNMIYQGCGHVSGQGHASGGHQCRVACGPNATFADGRIVCSTILSAIIVNQMFGENPTTSCSGGDVCANHVGHCNSSNPATCPPISDTGPGIFTIDCHLTSTDDFTVGFIQEDTTYTFGGVDDKRTPADIANGCIPCTFQFNGAIVTVTDSFGSEAMATITTTD